MTRRAPLNTSWLGHGPWTGHNPRELGPSWALLRPSAHNCSQEHGALGCAGWAVPITCQTSCNCKWAWYTAVRTFLSALIAALCAPPATQQPLRYMRSSLSIRLCEHAFHYLRPWPMPNYFMELSCLILTGDNCLAYSMWVVSSFLLYGMPERQATVMKYLCY